MAISVKSHSSTHCHPPCSHWIIPMYANITYSGCSSAPCTPAPKRGMVISCGTSITHSLQRSAPQTRTKTPPCLWRSGPRPLLSVNAGWADLQAVNPLQKQRWLIHRLFLNILKFLSFFSFFFLHLKWLWLNMNNL